MRGYDAWKTTEPDCDERPEPEHKKPIDYSVKIDALLDGHISIDSSWTEADFYALAMAALDQAGISTDMQKRIGALMAIEVGDPDVPEPYDLHSNGAA